MAAIRAFVEAAELKKPRRVPVLEVQTVPVAAADEETATIVESDEAEVLLPSDPVASTSTGIAVIDVQPTPKHGAKRRVLFRAIDRLFGRGKVSSANRINHAAREHGAADLSLSDSEDSAALLRENSRLKERVSFLEAEMAKANSVLRKIEVLSKLD